MTIFNKNIIIAIDGYSSCGKSTLAKSLAEKIGYTYIDSGAMYRAVTIICLEKRIINNEKINTKNLIKELQNIDIRFIYNNINKKTETHLNGKNVEKEIRSIEIANYVSIISKIPEIREKLVNIQKNLGKNKRIVMDGRDIGTVVFPMAEIKIFMTADINVRAERRFKELIKMQENVTIDETKDNLTKRDFIDINRKESPLKIADDAIILDNSYLTPEDQLNWVIGIISRKFQIIIK